MRGHPVYIEKFVDENQLIEKDLKKVVVNAMASTSDYRSFMKETLLEENETVLKPVTSTQFRNLQQSFDNSFTNQSGFYRNYMILFKAIFILYFAFDMTITTLT